MQPGKDGVNFSKQDALPFMNGVIHKFDHIASQIIGVNTENKHLGKQMDGVNDQNDTIGVQMDGVNLPDNTAAAQHDAATLLGNAGNNNNMLLHAEKSTSPTPADASHHAQAAFHYNGKPVILFVNTPQDIAAGKPPVSYHKLFAALRKQLVKTTNGGLVNTAQIVMKLYESPAQSLKSLQKLTHLSEDGITKRIMSMKKFGLIVRAPGRQLLLAAKARALLDEAR